MCDSSFEMELERASSEKKARIYEVVPKDTSIKLKFKACDGKTYKFFEFILKEGKSLPYELLCKGNQVGIAIYHHNLGKMSQ